VSLDLPAVAVDAGTEKVTTMTRRSLALFAAAGLLAGLGACGGTESEVAPTAAQQEQPGSDTGPFPAGEPIDLVYVSDSAGAGVAELYADLAAEALDREVRVDEHVKGDARLTELRDLVRFSIADEVAEAEIIVLYGNPEGLEPEPQPTLACIEAAADPASFAGPPPVVTVADWQAYRDALDEFYDEIWTLRAGRPTILRTHDMWNPFIATWRQEGIEPACTANWEVYSQVIREAAAANGAGFATVFDVFNGPEHDQDPNDQGWISDDGAHASEAGHAVIAQALADVGFEATQRPA
jgi:hypothetical protein